MILRGIKGSRRLFSSVAATVNERVARFPTKDVVQFKDHKYKWNLRQLETHSIALAHGLDFLGLKEGEKVLNLLPPSVEQLNICMAATYSGFKVISFQEEPSLGIVEATIQQEKPKIVFVEEKSAFKLGHFLPDFASSAINKGMINCEELPSLKFVIHTGPTLHKNTLRYLDVLAYNSTFQPREFSVDDSTEIITVLDKNGKLSRTFTLAELMEGGREKADKIGVRADAVIESEVIQVEDGVLLTLGALQSLGKVVLKF